MKYIPKTPHELRQAITFYTASLNYCQDQRDPDDELVNYLLHKIEVYRNCMAATKSQYTKNSDIIF